MSRKKTAPLRKRFIQSRTAHVILSYIAAAFMRLVYLSCRVERIWPDSIEPYFRGKKNAIFVFWHGRLIMCAFMKPPRPMTVLISQSNDGALISTCMERFDIGAVRGSKKKGSSEAVRSLVDALGKGDNIAITPDGPRGPFQVAAAGAIYVAMRTGHPIIPVAFSATRHWRLNSWDRFMIPKPFSRIRFVADAPYTVPGDMAEDKLPRAVADMQERLNELTRKVDLNCGVDPA